MTAPTASVIACFRYKDAPAAIEWLCKAFGFERHLVVPDEKGGIAHAELKFNCGMIMLGSARDDEFGQLLKPPIEGNSSVVTNTMYVIVNDVEGHFRRAASAGANVITPPTEQDFGGQLQRIHALRCIRAPAHHSNYTCRDPEGYVWTFGDYDPGKPPK
jgi:uncharacterized glyoxalase superfamily protein PhnB